MVSSKKNFYEICKKWLGSKLSMIISIFIWGESVHQNDIHALPCLRYERRQKKPMPISYPGKPVTIGDHIRKKRMELKLKQSDVAKILKVTQDSIYNWGKNRSIPLVKYFPAIIKLLTYLPFEVDTSIIGGKLKDYRYRNGLTQEQM
ncbi:hypothetical protein [Chitinophaga sp. RAB17]|uniref:hypothetical protein n=1 Tax=Chitinophaga sp. RAB17 TaxID=3233049 RepID=UPI003F8FB590